jgi:hypothetical protein
MIPSPSYKLRYKTSSAREMTKDDCRNIRNNPNRGNQIHLFHLSIVYHIYTPSKMSDDSLQCFFMGTGTSTGLPLAPCLTLSSDLPSDVADIKTNGKRQNPLPGQYDPNGLWPENVPCGSCRAAVDKDVPEGYKNKRGNTSMVIRKKIHGKWFNIVLDVGKTFRENANRYFPVWGVQTIDAVILTHGRMSFPSEIGVVADDRCGCFLWNG